MGGVAFKFLPAFDSAFLQFFATADSFKVVAGFRIALPDGQGQSPVAFFGDHPIVHIAQPIQFAIFAKRRYPVDFFGDIHNLVAQTGFFFFRRHFCARFVVEFAHTNEPLVNQAKDQFGFAAPAGGVAVGVVFYVVQESLLLQIFKDRRGNVADVLAAEPVKAVYKVTFVVNGSDEGEVVFAAKLKIFRAAAGGNVYNARAFGFAHFIPGDNLMRFFGAALHALYQFAQFSVTARFLRGGQFVKGAVVSPADHFRAF